MTENQAMLWVEALRSGKYKQVGNHLKAKKGHCCLGVLCELSQKVEFEKHPDDDGIYAVIDGNNVDFGALPLKVMAEFRLSNSEGRPSCRVVTIDGNEYTSLAHANDSGVSFAKIADWIEENYMYL